MLLTFRPDLALIETWISNDDSPIFSQLKQLNYILIISPRLNGRRGGGVDILIKCRFRIKSNNSLSFSYYDGMLVNLAIISTSNLQLICIYHPPIQSCTLFGDEFSDIIHSLIILSLEILIIILALQRLIMQS